MPASSLIDLKFLTAETLSRIFSLSKELSLQKMSSGVSSKGTAGLLFFEPSTRTRMSFEFACAREGLAPVVLSGEAGSSLEKGESLEDTILNVAAMKPDVLVIRCGDQLDLSQISESVSIPILNAGWGQRGHPTQALLDAWTLVDRWGTLQGKKILILGDVRHSRVAASHLELSRILGYEIALGGPQAFLPKDPVVPVFDRIEEGLRWADAVMALRVQKERHESQNSGFSDFAENWGMNRQRLSLMKPGALLMHPGPVNWGTEVSVDLAGESRSVILDQVTHGVFLRQALLRFALEGLK